MFNNLLLLIILILIASCSTSRNIMLGPVATVLYDASFISEEENNYTNFKQGIMPSIKLAEGLWSVKKGDLDLLVTLIKGYAAHGLLINETDYLIDKFSERDESEHKEQAIYNYSQAVIYGTLFLKEEGMDFGEMVRMSRQKGGIAGYLNDHLSNNLRSLEGIMYFAQALSGLINLQKDDMRLVIHASTAKEMFDWVCKNRPDMNYGACGIFYGAYEASRPRMLGGNPKLGKKIFLKTIKQFPHNWLARVMFIEHYLIPMGEENGYKVQKNFLKKAGKRFEKVKKWGPNREKYLILFGEKKYRIYQMIAIEKFKIIQKFEKDLF